MQFVMYISSKNHFVWRLHPEWGGDTPIIHYCTLNDLQNDFSATGQEMIEINTLKKRIQKTSLVIFANMLQSTFATPYEAKNGKQNISKGPNLDGAAEGFRKKSWSLEFEVFCHPAISFKRWV